jgi:hypothetical protein
MLGQVVYTIKYFRHIYQQNPTVIDGRALRGLLDKKDKMKKTKKQKNFVGSLNHSHNSLPNPSLSIITPCVNNKDVH